MALAARMRRSSCLGLAIARRVLTNPAWIKAKAILLLLLGLLSVTLLCLERPTVRVAALLLLAVWSFCLFLLFCVLRLGTIRGPHVPFLRTCLAGPLSSSQPSRQILKGRNQFLPFSCVPGFLRARFVFEGFAEPNRVVEYRA